MNLTLPVKSTLSQFSLRRKWSPAERGAPPGDHNAPTRLEVYGAERLQEYAVELARRDQLTETPGAHRLLLPRLKGNERVLFAAHKGFVAEVNSQQPIPPGAEWLLDNFHIVQEQLREIHQDLSRRFYGELPELANGAYAGYPRVYGLAMELLTHSDNRLDARVITGFAGAYQTVSPLTTGELWAFPIMLRVGLIENLQGMMSQSLKGLRARRRADAWADRLLLLRNRPASELLVSLADLAQSSGPEAEFVLQLMHRLRDQGPAVAPAIQWLETLLAQAHSDIDAYLRELNHRRAINRVSVGNIITSMRLLSSLDWRPLVESLSQIDRVLERDPAGAYGRMDFGTRDRYRHVIEKLAKRSHSPEAEVAQGAIHLASRTKGHEKREAHVGYFLIDKGLAELQGLIGYRPGIRERAAAWISPHAGLVYLGAICALTLLFVAGGLLYASRFAAAAWALPLVAVLMLLPASVFALDIVNATVTLRVHPFAPPKLDFTEGIPPDCRTLVVVPAMLGSRSGIEYLLEHLERRYLANRDDNLLFALLSDFGDAPAQHMPEDEELRLAAVSGIEALNAKYAGDHPGSFFLFNRERRWNPVARTWMAWERKRGNLTELNRFLRRAAETSFTTIVGERARLENVRYVITLDADTELPLNAARRLVGAIAHPLNHAVVDPRQRRVVEGYGIIQPRVDVTAEAAAQSPFSRIFSGNAGLDPYSSAVSDVYQDLFHAGVYIGKGIYDVDAMRQALENRFPENLLLSHDLIEGTFARTGLASDIVLLEDWPSGYDAFSQRQDRWTRGDWQITDWLLPRAPDENGKRAPNPLPAVERWKIMDNLRRSLIPPGIVLLLAAAWTILPGQPLVWTMIGLVAMFFTLVRGVFVSVQDHPQGEPWRDYFLALGNGLMWSGLRALLVLTMYLFQATENVDAILRAITRRLLNPGRLLEWVSAAAVEHGQAKTPRDYLQRMWLAPALSILLFILVASRSPGSLAVAAPILGLWIVSPWVAYRISQPRDTKPQDLPAQAKRELTELATRMWGYYDDFAVAEDHWLPPDNYQIEPKAVIAHRTSPTNIGFLLLAILAAFDFRIIRRDEVADRLERVFRTLAGMERYRGHWFNWYDTLTLQPLHPAYVSTVDSGNLGASLIVVKQACLELAESGDGQAQRMEELADCADKLARGMDLQFLYNAEREIFATGYNTATNQLDTSYYDLFASEARLTSLLAIALEQAPERHWFHLARPLTRKEGHVTLLSWGGSMFEYLLPTLFVSDQPYTLLHETYGAIVGRQIAYAAERRIPWGISESGYHAFDLQFNYQYRLFGVPDLSLKREFGDDLVIAPYATFLALPFAPHHAWENLGALQRAGGLDRYGFYEGLDYTLTRRPRGQAPAVVRSFMAHHQGMSLVALDNYLNGYPMRRRFEREPAIAAVVLLLQERIPRHTPLVQAPPERRPEQHQVIFPGVSETRSYATPHTPLPRAHLLSNGEYTVMLTNAGGGYSVCGDLDVTRWREDATCDGWGSFVYVKDVERGQTWSDAYQPTRHEPEDYRVTYSPGIAEFLRFDYDVETKTEIAVSPENNVEVRRLTLTNRGARARSLDLTSYAEAVLDTHRADAAHPAFGKLFVETEHAAGKRMLLFKRRPHRKDQAPVWAFHLLSGAELKGEIEYETDRARFLGRGGTTAKPAALEGRLGNTAGAVLDPVMSLRGRVRLRPGESVRLAFVTGVTASREAALSLADEYSDERYVERAFEQARVHGRVLLQHLNISAHEGQLFQRVASRILYPEPAFQAPAEIIARNVKGQSGLWPHGVSGDYPIVLVRVDSAEELGLARQMLLAHEYWRQHNLSVELVILDESPTMYNEGLRVAIEGLINTSLSHPWLDRPGGIFVRRADHMPPEDKVLLQTAARVILNGDLGDLDDQLKLTPPPKSRVLPRRPASRDSVSWKPTSRRLWSSASSPSTASPRAAGDGAKVFDNGLGGFSQDGREYVITLKGNQWTPAPWSNVIANSDFGTLVTAAGLGCAWATNSQQNKLTPWSNDSVSDPPGQIVYLQDRETREVWTPTPSPVREDEPYVIRHGTGYSTFEHTSHAVVQSLTVFVPPSDPVQVIRLKLKNLSQRVRRINAVFYADWVLGVTREGSKRSIVTEYDAGSRALYARNTFNAEFGPRVAFAAAGSDPVTFTADRAEFLGRNGAVDRPAALFDGGKLSGSVGAAMDPCAVLVTPVELSAGEEKEVVFMLGQVSDVEVARRLIAQYRNPAQVRTGFDLASRYWEDLLGTVQVQTPDPALDIMMNRWLLYQVLACRVWGRTGFYQSSGAWGFRDQLQDVMALVYAAPQLAREHILRAAGRQFEQGDVQHWWHAPLGKGVRTRISDDPLWLPFVVEHYVTTTGDRAILDEPVPFLQAPTLGEEQEEAYGQPDISRDKGSVHEHCLRAIDHGWRLGEHGLPLMGAGDWNDGMNAVGEAGKGESIWLGWFLYANLVRYADICDVRGDVEHARTYRSRAAELEQAQEKSGWDGEWYRRGYFDDGTPLGSKENVECRIDSVAQSWSIIADAASTERRAAALEAVEQQLVREGDGLILLLSPPFDQSTPSPGYLQGYIPGIRENGGQYTHGALWVVLASILQGDGDRAYKLLQMLNPIRHADSPERIERYKVEPYVVAGDVYSHPSHTGRGGWTWYTGSAGWMYRIIFESMLGFKLRGDVFSVDPCIPREWPEYRISYRDGDTRYEIAVENPDGVNRGVRQVQIDGVNQSGKEVHRKNDGKLHKVRVVMG